MESEKKVIKADSNGPPARKVVIGNERQKVWILKVPVEVFDMWTEPQSINTSLASL